MHSRRVQTHLRSKRSSKRFTCHARENAKAKISEQQKRTKKTVRETFNFLLRNKFKRAANTLDCSFAFAFAPVCPVCVFTRAFGRGSRRNVTPIGVASRETTEMLHSFIVSSWRRELRRENIEHFCVCARQAWAYMWLSELIEIVCNAYSYARFVYDHFYLQVWKRKVRRAASSMRYDFPLPK